MMGLPSAWTKVPEGERAVGHALRSIQNETARCTTPRFLAFEPESERACELGENTHQPLVCLEGPERPPAQVDEREIDGIDKRLAGGGVLGSDGAQSLGNRG